MEDANFNVQNVKRETLAGLDYCNMQFPHCIISREGNGDAR